jgi:Tfp pilus assembly protein PilF
MYSIIPRTFFFVAAVAINLPLLSASAGGSADSTAWRLVAQGKALLAENKLKEAEQSFRKALQKDRQLIAAIAGLGAVYFAKKNWGEANDWYEKVLDRDPDNLDALYHRGVCYRETGVNKVLMFRKLDWDNSAKNFERVLAADSSFYDTLFQFAQLLRYRDDYTDAILMGHRQVRLRPDLIETQRGLFRLYQYFLDNKNFADAIDWLREHDSEQARYSVGEAYRRANKLAAADSVFSRLLAASPGVSLMPIYLSLARLHYQQKEDGAAEKAYWQAVNNIRNRLDAELVFEDAKYLVSENELRQFRRLATPQEYADFFQRFWTSRDPTPAAANNARLAEHYRRLLLAEKDFLFDGFRTWFNNPDKIGYQKFPPTFYLNDRFNDRGLIYIRHGEPDDRVFTGGATTAESWHYKPRVNSPEMIFHFVIDENAAGNNWRLTPFIDTQQFWEDRVNFGTSYSRMLLGGQLERLTLIEEIGQQSRAAVDTGFRFDRHTWDKNTQPLNAAAYAAFFKAPEGKSYFDLYYSLSLPSVDDLARAGNTQALCEHGMTLHDLQWRQVEQRRDEILREQIPDLTRMQSLIGQYHFAVPPDSYHVAFFLRQPLTKRLGGWKEDLRVPDFNAETLAISSIVLASSIAPASAGDFFVRNGLKIVPNPSKRFPRAQPVYVYVEVYNLTPHAAGKSSFIIEYTTLLRKEKKSGTKKVFSIFGDKTKPSTTLSMEREAEGATSVEYLALDLNKAGVGDFRLSIKVKDKNSGKQCEGFIDLTLF